MQGRSSEGDESLTRDLKPYHIALISIGGVIGTGLFLGTANALQRGGPAGLFLAYVFMGFICIALMLSLGEFASYLPVPGGHITLSGRFVGPQMSFAMGWTYWFNWIVTAGAEISACAVLVSFWNDKINPAVWISIFLAVVIGINLLGTRAYGETESVFASIKVVTIIGLIIMSFILDLGGGPNGDRIGFRYWKDPGPFVQYLGIAGALGRFLGFYKVFCSSAFSFIGCEIVAMTAGEARNPRINIPRAVKTVFLRIALFYVLGTLAISVLVPSNHPTLALNVSTGAKSPFVIAIKRAGIKGLPSVINAAILSSAASAASSDIYTSSRALHGLAISGQAPAIFARTTSRGLPFPSLCVSILLSGLSYSTLTGWMSVRTYTSLSVGEGSNKVFDYLSSMASVCGLVTWWSIAITYIRFRKGMLAQRIPRESLPFSSPLQPFLAYYVLVAITIILLTHGFDVFLHGHWDTPVFITSYLPTMLFVVMYFGSGFYLRSKIIAPEEMDFVSDLQEIIDAEVPVELPKTWWGKVGRKIF